MVSLVRNPIHDSFLYPASHSSIPEAQQTHKGNVYYTHLIHSYMGTGNPHYDLYKISHRECQSTLQTLVISQP